MSGHTAGPWKVIPSPHGRDYLCVQVGTDDSYTTLEMLPDDARLIAAAPDLLAALERCAIRLAAMGHSAECSESPDGPCVCGNTQAMDQYRAAIAKATQS